MMIKKMLFGYTPILNENVNFGLLLVRLFAGFSLAFAHGINKIPPSDGFINGISDLGFFAPPFFAWMSGIAEFFGGILVALGLATRPAALLIGINMGVAAFLQHANDPYTAKERALLFFFIALLTFITGAGKYSLDKLISRK
jgi:putative oxidoreductase